MIFENIKINVYYSLSLFFDLLLLYYFLFSQIFPFLPLSCPQNLTILSTTMFNACLTAYCSNFVPFFFEQNSTQLEFDFNESISNPNTFSLSTCVNLLCYDYRLKISIPAMLVFVLTSG